MSPNGDGPKLTGKAGGYPEYNNWVVITKDGRLPWIPQTLADKLDAEGERRRKKLEEWQRTRAQMKPMDEAAAQKTYEMLKKSDPAGAEKFLAEARSQAEEVKRLQQEVYPANTAQFEKEVKDYEQYRASFTVEQLRAPAVWGDQLAPAGESWMPTSRRSRHCRRQYRRRSMPCLATTNERQRRARSGSVTWNPCPIGWPTCAPSTTSPTSSPAPRTRP